MKIDEIIEKQEDELNKKIKSIVNNQIIIDISPEQFKTLILINIKNVLWERNTRREFELTEDNIAIINQLYFYCTNNINFKGDCTKGIILQGSNGIGKSLIMKAFLRMIGLIHSKNIIDIHAKLLPRKIIEKGLEYYVTRPLYIDDIGKEAKEIIDYGTKIHPIPDLISLKYENKSMLFGTCNYNESTLKEFYGKTVSDRIKEKSNFIVMKGKNYRE